MFSVHIEFILGMLTKLQALSHYPSLYHPHMKMVLDLLLKSGASLWNSAHPRQLKDYIYY